MNRYIEKPRFLLRGMKNYINLVLVNYWKVLAIPVMFPNQWKFHFQQEIESIQTHHNIVKLIQFRIPLIFLKNSKNKERFLINRKKFFFDFCLQFYFFIFVNICKKIFFLFFQLIFYQKIYKINMYYWSFVIFYSFSLNTFI